MHAVAMRVDVRIPYANSLKEKRRVVARLEAGLRKAFGVSVAEVDHQDLHRRTALGVAVVSGEAFHLRRVCSSVERWFESQPEIEVLGVEIGHLVPE